MTLNVSLSNNVAESLQMLTSGIRLFDVLNVPLEYLGENRHIL